MLLRLSCRALARAPWYAATTIGTIALTIALGATAFAVVDGVLFKPLPYRGADRLFSVRGSAGPGDGTASLAALDIVYLREADPRLTVASFAGGTSIIHPDQHPDQPAVRLWSKAVGRAFFDVLGQYPLVGGFTADHYASSTEGAPTPAIVSHAFWRQWFGADPEVIGRALDTVGRRFLVVGVLPADFVFPEPIDSVVTEPDILVPAVVGPDAATDRWNRGFHAMVRLGDDIALDEAQARLDAALATRADEYPPAARPVRPGPYVAVSLTPIDRLLGWRERPVFSLAFAGAGLLILLGAINVTGLFAARVQDRRQELSTRAALGAGRRHMVSAVLAEALVVASLGGALGILLSAPLLRVALALVPDTVQLLKAPFIDWRVAAFAGLAAVGPVLLFSFLPAWAAARQASVTGHMSAPRVRSWGRSLLLVAENAIGITLVVTGSLMLASYVGMRAQDAGFDVDRLALVELLTAEPALERRAVERMRAMPAVQDVAVASVPVLDHLYPGSRFRFPEGAESFRANDIPVSASFFEVVGLNQLEGRLPTRREIDSAQPVAVVSEGTARAYWPDRPAVGQILRGDEVSVAVIGVVEDARFGAQDDDGMGEIYVPEGLWPQRWKVYFVRTVGDPSETVRDLTLVLRQDVPGVLVRRAESLDRALVESVRLPRFRAVLFGLAAGAGLLVLAVGAAGLVAISVARRVREIGIRAALGATPSRLQTMIVLEHLRPSIAGLLVGILASSWMTQLVSGFLYRLDAHDPAVWTIAAAALLLTTGAAAWIPARRGTAADPMAVLKTE